MLQVRHIDNSVFNSRTYILSEGNSTDVWLVDCGNVERLPDEVNVVGVLLTHTHSDHIYGLNKLLEKFPSAEIITNEFGKKALVDPRLNISRYHSEYDDFVLSDTSRIQVVEESMRLKASGFDVWVYETPGHDPSCLTFKIGSYLFTGDAYIPGVKVFTGFPKSDKMKADGSMQRIVKMSEGLTVCPGHKVNEE